MDYAPAAAFVETARQGRFGRIIKTCPPVAMFWPYLRVIDSLLKEGRGIGTIPDVPPIGTTPSQIRPEVLKAMALVEADGGYPVAQNPLVLIIAGMLTTQPKEPDMATKQDAIGILTEVRASIGKTYVEDPGHAATLAVIADLLGQGAKLPSPFRYSDLPKWNDVIASKAASLIYQKEFALAGAGTEVSRPATTGYTVLTVALLMASLPQYAVTPTPAPTPTPSSGGTAALDLTTEMTSLRQAVDALGVAAVAVEKAAQAVMSKAG